MEKRFQSYIITAIKLINAYKGEMPLAAWLKNYFSQNKKHGSTDRRQIAHLCYCYYRLGNALEHLQAEERLPIAYFLCNEQAGHYHFLYNEDWLQHWDADVNARVAFVAKSMEGFAIQEVFKTNAFVGGLTDINHFIGSHFTQPDLFLRIRPGNDKKALETLGKNNIPFVQVNDICLALPNNTKVDSLLKLNSEVVVQDYSSQQIATMLQVVKGKLQAPYKIWDCCAASGGKSILAKDILHNIELTVTDIRSSIIVNLRKRFEEAGIKKYQSFVSDASKQMNHTGKFNFIIADVPCSGSGTWSRTPEHLSFFNEQSIASFHELQKGIAGNVLTQLQGGGYLLYITCSVFEKENEAVVSYLSETHQLVVVKQQYFEGYTMKADTMFAALLQRQKLV